MASKIPKCPYTGIFEIIHIGIPVFEKIPVYPVYYNTGISILSRLRVSDGVAEFIL